MRNDSATLCSDLAAGGAGAQQACLIGAGRPKGFLHAFWAALVAAGGWAQNHPCLPADSNQWDHCIPIWLHADEAQYIKKDEQKAYIFNWSSLAYGAAKRVRFLIGALPCDRMATQAKARESFADQAKALLRWPQPVAEEPIRQPDEPTHSRAVGPAWWHAEPTRSPSQGA